MGRGRKYLIAVDLNHVQLNPESAALDEQLAAWPEAAELAVEEVEDFLAAAVYLDSFAAADIVPGLRRAGLAIPAELTYDSYRLGRYVFRRWRDPQVRDALFATGRINYQTLVRMRRRNGPEFLSALLQASGSTAFATLRRHGMTDCLQELRTAPPPELAARCQAWLKVGRLILYRYLTEPEPSRQPSRWEQQKLIRRLRLRDVQLRSLRRSQHRLRREQMELAGRLRDAGLRDQPELAALAAELELLRQQQREDRQRHLAEMAALAGRFGPQLDQLTAELQAVQRDCHEMMVLRAAWLPAQREG